MELWVVQDGKEGEEQEEEELDVLGALEIPYYSHRITQYEEYQMQNHVSINVK